MLNILAKGDIWLFLQDIIPHSSSGVVELFVPPSELEVKKREAEALPKLNITKIDCQWLQVWAS